MTKDTTRIYKPVVAMLITLLLLAMSAVAVLGSTSTATAEPTRAVGKEGWVRDATELMSSKWTRKWKEIYLGR